MNVNVLEQDAIDMDFTNLTLAPAAGNTGVVVSGSYIYTGTTYSINVTLPLPAIPNNTMVNEWNLYFWTTDHTWHLDIGAMSYPPEDPSGVVVVAFGWIPGSQCKTKADPSIWHVKPLPKDQKNPRPGHGVTSDGAHYHTPAHGKGAPVLVSPPTVTN